MPEQPIRPKPRPVLTRRLSDQMSDMVLGESETQNNQPVLSPNIQKSLGAPEKVSAEKIENYVETVNQTEDPLQAVLYASMLTSEKEPDESGYRPTELNLDENDEEQRRTIYSFFKNALGSLIGEDYDPRDKAWCAAFVDATLTKIGADRLDSWSRIRANDYTKYGVEVDIEDIRPGDIVIFDWSKDGKRDGRGDHVTFYAGDLVDGVTSRTDSIRVLGGNQGDRRAIIGTDQYGNPDRNRQGVVSVKNYSKKDILAVRRITRDSKPWERIKDQNPLFFYSNKTNPSYGFDKGGDVSAQMQSMLPSADDDIRPEDYPQYKPDDFTGRSFAADSFQETKDRFMDAGKIDVDPDDPAIFTAYKRAVDYLKDTGLAGLGLADTAFKYAVGSVAQVMPTEQLEKRMARDLYSMPEAFGGAVGAKSITQLDDAADAFLAGSKQVAQKLKTEYDPTMVRSFVGATPPTYQEREAPLSLLSGESDSASDEVLDIYNMGLLMFREPVVEFAETLDIPKKGLLGSEFLNRVKKNPSIPETSLQESVIEPSRRYTKDELLRALGVNANTKGTFRSVANISPARIKQFEQYQRQRRDAGFVGGTEIDYFDIPVDVTIGYPGKKFKAHSQHYQDETLVHVRGSIIDSSVPFSEFSTGPTGEIVIDSTRNFPAFDTIIDDDNFLLVEEIQSDLLTKGYVKPKSPFDAAFSEAIEEYDFESPVKYQEAYGDISTDIQKIFKELDEESIYSPELPIQLGSLNSNPFFSPETETVFTNKILDKGYTTFEELKDYIKSQNTSSNYFWGMLSRLERRVPGVSVVNTAPGGKTYSDLSFDLDNEEFEELWETFYESVKGSEIDHEIHMHRYEDFIDDYNKVILKKIKEKGLSKELDLNDLQRLREKYEGAGAKGTLNVGLPPIRKNKQAVDEALKVLIAKAAQQGVDKIVIPPAERIAMARGRELKKDKGDRFYRTYVTDLNKSLKELEDNYPVIVHRDVELPYLSKTDVEDGDPFGMMNEPDFTEIDEDGVALEDIQDLMDADAQDIANIVNPTAEITEPLGDELLPPSKRKKLIKTDNKGTILDISELIDKYKIEQPRQFAKGGVAMNEQMEMAFMNQGGLKDDGMDQDPVSGNEIPSGSMAKEVRDDISANLSEGEYVVPADVVRFFGVKFFEDLRAEAKMGLQTMEANGRIGGEPVDEPMQDEGEMSDEEFEQLIRQELGSMQMAEGGMVPDMNEDYEVESSAPVAFNEGGYEPGEGDTSFNPFSYIGLGSTLTPGYVPPPEVGTESPVESESSCAARGLIYNPNTKMCDVPQKKSSDNEETGSDVEDYTPKKPEVDYFKLDEESLKALGTGEEKDVFGNKVLKAAGVMMSGPITLALGAFSAAKQGQSIAQLRAAAKVAEVRGLKDTAKLLNTRADTLVGNSSPLIQGLDDLNLLTGNNYFADQVNSFGAEAELSRDEIALGGLGKDKTDKEFKKLMDDSAPKGMVYKPGEGYIRPGSLLPDTSPKPKTRPSGDSSNNDGPSAAQIAQAAAAKNQTPGTSNTYVGRTDSSGKKLGETGYKSALKERQEAKQAKEDAVKAGQEAGKGYAGGYGFAEGGLMKKKRKK